MQNCNFTWRLEWFWPLPLSHTFFKIDVLSKTCHKNGAFQTTLQLHIPMEQHDSTPLKHHSETANPNGTTTQTCHFHETLRLCSETHHLSCITYNFYANHNGIAAQTDTWHVHEKSRFRALPNGRAIGAGFEHLRTVEDGCEHENNDRRTQLYPQTPKVKREPFATHSGKNIGKFWAGWELHHALCM